MVALSTYLALGESLEAEAAAANRATPIFMAHGTEDPIVPMRLAELSRSMLQSRGYEVEWHSYPMPHGVCAEEIEAIAQFLLRVIGDEEDAPARSSIILTR